MNAHCTECDGNGYHAPDCPRAPRLTAPTSVEVCLRLIVERASRPFDSSAAGVPFVKVPAALIEQARTLLKLPK